MFTLVVLTLAATVLYLVLFEVILSRIKSRANEYWKEIGSPHGQSASATTSILKNLYRKEMTSALAGTRSSGGLLSAIRVLLPIAVLLNLVMLCKLVTM